MPFLPIKRALALAAFTSVISGTSAFAEIHEVMILDEAFFPAELYVKPGDQLHFVNNASGSRTVMGPEETWTSNALSVGATYTYDVSTASPLAFQSMSGGSGGEAYEGTITFDDPPLSE